MIESAAYIKSLIDIFVIFSLFKHIIYVKQTFSFSGAEKEIEQCLWLN